MNLDQLTTLRRRAEWHGRVITVKMGENVMVRRRRELPDDDVLRALAEGKYLWRAASILRSNTAKVNERIKDLAARGLVKKQGIHWVATTREGGNGTEGQ